MKTRKQRRPLSLSHRLGAEFVGTFALVLVGCGAIVVDSHTGGAVTQPGVALAFGLVVMVAIYALGDVSGAHINPAVSLGFWLSGSLQSREAVGYLLAQCGGAVAASWLLRIVFPLHETLGATLPEIGPGPAWLVEIAITFLLVFVVFQVVSAGPALARVGGFVIGATVGLAAFYAGPLTGASMNPARSLGPALVSGAVAHFWIYWTAPFVGAALAFYGCRLLRGPDCCRG